MNYLYLLIPPKQTFMLIDGYCSDNVKVQTIGVANSDIPVGILCADWSYPPDERTLHA